MSADPRRAAILISGSGTNLQSLIDTVEQTGIEIRLVISDKADAYGLQRARAAAEPAETPATEKS